MVFKGLQFIEKFGKLDTRHNSEIRFHFCKYLQLSYYLLVWGPKIILISVQPISWSKLFWCGNGKVQPRYIQILPILKFFKSPCVCLSDQIVQYWFYLYIEGMTWKILIHRSFKATSPLYIAVSGAKPLYWDFVTNPLCIEVILPKKTNKENKLNDYYSCCNLSLRH